MLTFSTWRMISTKMDAEHECQHKTFNSFAPCSMRKKKKKKFKSHTEKNHGVRVDNNRFELHGHQTKSVLNTADATVLNEIWFSPLFPCPPHQNSTNFSAPCCATRTTPAHTTHQTAECPIFFFRRNLLKSQERKRKINLRTFGKKTRSVPCTFS